MPSEPLDTHALGVHRTVQIQIRRENAGAPRRPWSAAVCHPAGATSGGCHALLSPGWTGKPDLPFDTRSGALPTRMATMGIPSAIASITDPGKESGSGDASTATPAPPLPAGTYPGPSVAG